MEFSKKLYELRKQKGISQEELADRLAVSRQTLSKWELGTSTPDMEKLIMISDFFEISMDELVLGKKQEYDRNNGETQTKISEFLNNNVLTQKNKRRTVKIAKTLGIIIGILVAIDVSSMIVYFIFWGTPK